MPTAWIGRNGTVNHFANEDRLMVPTTALPTFALARTMTAQLKFEFESLDFQRSSYLHFLPTTMPFRVNLYPAADLKGQRFCFSVTTQGRLCLRVTVWTANFIGVSLQVGSRSHSNGQPSAPTFYAKVQRNQTTGSCVLEEEPKWASILGRSMRGHLARAPDRKETPVYREMQRNGLREPESQARWQSLS